jgi:hypothetical protein
VKKIKLCYTIRVRVVKTKTTLREEIFPMSDIINAISEMNTETLIVLGFAALLLIFLLVLIVITIKVLRTNGLEDDDTEEEKLPDTEEEEDESAARSKMVDEIAKSVEEAKAKMEAEKNSSDEEDVDEENLSDEEKDERAKKAAKEKAEAITRAVTGEDDEEEADDDESDDEEYDPDEADYSEDDLDDESEADIVDNTEEDDDDYDDSDSSVKEHTDKLDTVRIEEELRKVREESADNVESMNETAKLRAESPDYNASFDSAFVEKPDNDENDVEPVIPNPTVESVMGENAESEGETEEFDEEVPGGTTLDVSEEETLKKAVRDARTADKITVNPVNEVNINTVNSVEEVNTTNPKAGINDMNDMKDFMEENPEPKNKKRKVKKKDRAFEEKFGTHGDEIKTAKYFWYNTQDIEGLARKEDMYFKCHYFDDADNAILDLVTEMYDCAFVRTEQLQRIAYGITFQSMSMKNILRSEENLGFNRDKATKEPTEADKEEIYKKWCEYVDNFHKIIVINAPEDVEQYIIDKMYEYGRRDVEELMYSPY